MLVAKQNTKRSIHGVTSFNLSQKPCSATGSAPASTPPAPEGAAMLLVVFNFLDFLVVLLHMYVYISSKVLLIL